MPISRRNLLRRIAAGAITGAAIPSLSGFSFAKSAAPAPLPSPAAPLLLYRNENAYGASQRVLAVLREACSGSNRYPRTEYDTLLNKLATDHSVKAEQIVLGCGSSEILRLAMAAFLGPGKNLIQASPTYPVPGKIAQSLGATVIEIPLNKLFQHDLNAMLERVDSSTGLVYICNPNNPTGTLTPRKDIEAFIRKLPATAMVLLDEAYHHYVDPTSSYVSFLDEHFDDPRLIVARTFSKIYGLAGMRIGYGVAGPYVARRFSAERLQFGVGILAAKAASAALDDSEHVRLGIKRNTDDRQEFMNQVNARMLRALESHTNFVMVNPMRPPEAIIDHLKKNNVLIGPLIPAMDKYIRVSLGTPEEMHEFWRVMDLLPPTGKMAM